ncbi:MAG: hypothetical protein JSU66_14760 [Deltaproteobacteria bacterium]|nr:MAG: hypothetical protein JSU66_14760 [Deltaproteobacteria bacterium]
MRRLEHRSARLRTAVRFTYAFHAREIRFERDAGDGFRRVFPETFSFHADRHDLAELYLQFEDLWANPRLFAEGASRRDAERLMLRLCAALPRYLEGVLDDLERGERIQPHMLASVHEDVALIGLIVARFMRDHGLGEREDLRLASVHLRKLALRSGLALIELRVTPEYLARYVAGEADPFDRGEAVSASDFFQVLARGGPGEVDRWIVGMTERAFYRWVEDVCLDESNPVFEREDSPFDTRETEVLCAVSARGSGRIVRGRELSPFLRRPGNKDCMRLLRRLEGWFLRQYDVHHAAAVITHADHLGRGIDDADRTLSRHSARYYLLLLLILASPFLGAIFAYSRAPRVFDALCTAEVVAVTAGVLWFLLYRFCWKRNLTFFRASVPRIGAGIIVGYLPVFLIDEVWDLARASWFTLGTLMVLLGFSTLLYLYVEVQRRLGDPSEAFQRARSIFLLGVFEAFALGLILTSLFGRFMVLRNWTDAEGAQALVGLQSSMPPLLGELPRILGFEPFLAFPSAVLLMTFLSFFIGTFLQLMWEDLPITEPL